MAVRTVWRLFGALWGLYMAVRDWERTVYGCERSVTQGCWSTGKTFDSLAHTLSLQFPIHV